MTRRNIIIISLILLAAAAGVIAVREFGRERVELPRSNVVDIRVPISYSQPLVIATFDLDFSIRPLEAHAAPMNTEAENRFRYIDAYPNTDVVQTKFTNKLKEDIILKSPGHPERFSYAIDDTWLESQFDSEGSLHLYPLGSDMSHTRFLIPAPFMIDANGEKSANKDVIVTFENGTLTLVPNPAWLSSHPYPITLDPTVEITVLNVNSVPTVGGPWEVRFTTVGGDTLVISGDPDNTVYGVNVEPESLSCGDRELSGEVLRQAQDDNTFRIVNWSCDTEAVWTVKVLKPGHHHQTFQFGGQTAEASNDTVSNDWCSGLSTWQYRRKITLNNSSQASAHTNFPAMVALTQAADVNNIDYSKTQNSGQDVRFCDQDNATALDYEIEKWDETATSTVWVEVPNITAASSTEHIWMYYGNTSTSTAATTTGVWDDNYKGVWHLDEGDSTAANFYEDSTSNANHGTLTDANGNSVAATGKVDGAFDFNGDADYIDNSSVAGEFSSNLGTAEAWVYRTFVDTVTTYPTPLAIGRIANTNLTEVWYNADSDVFNFHYVDGSGVETYVNVSASTIPQNQWVHIAWTWDTTVDQFKVYVNGSQQGTTQTLSGTWSAAATKAFIGATTDVTGPNNWMIGRVDDVRVSATARSADWIAFEYCNMNFTCQTYGSEEYYPRPANVPGVKFR